MRSVILLNFGIFLAISLNAQNIFPASGYVGIGTTAPATDLNIYSASSNGTTLTVANVGFPNTANSVGLSLNEGRPVATFRYRRDYSGLTEIGSLTGTEPVSFISGGVEKMRIDRTGNIGIGLVYPYATTLGKLQILQQFSSVPGIYVSNGSGVASPQIAVSDGTITSIFQTVPSTSKASIGTVSSNDFAIYTNSTNRLNVGADGSVSIGNVIIPAGLNYKLYVETGILTEKVKIALKTTSDWADYVFNKNYTLLSLNALDKFIAVNKHLPEVPCAKEVVKDGIDVARMDAVLLKKVEELTLYIIGMNKKIEALELKNKEIKEKLTKSK